jgi:catechol 2,3-dioxygenase-like lactoylglutathione lyase family enzyme
MALQGLAEMTLGVPKVDETRAFYREFGLSESSLGSLRLPTVASSCGREAYRQLVEYVLSAAHAEDVARSKANAEHEHLAVMSNDDGSISLREPVVGIGARVAVRPAVKPKPYESPIMNAPGNTARPGERAPAIFDQGPAQPRNLGHVLYATPDLDASMRFLQNVLGFELSDVSPGVIALLRCSRIITTSASSARPSVLPPLVMAGERRGRDR